MTALPVEATPAVLPERFHREWERHLRVVRAEDVDGELLAARRAWERRLGPALELERQRHQAVLDVEALRAEQARLVDEQLTVADSRVVRCGSCGGWRLTRSKVLGRNVKAHTCPAPRDEQAVSSPRH